MPAEHSPWHRLIKRVTSQFLVPVSDTRFQGILLEHKMCVCVSQCVCFFYSMCVFVSMWVCVPLPPLILHHTYMVWHDVTRRIADEDFEVVKRSGHIHYISSTRSLNRPDTHRSLSLWCPSLTHTHTASFPLSHFNIYSLLHAWHIICIALHWAWTCDLRHGCKVLAR